MTYWLTRRRQNDMLLSLNERLTSVFQESIIGFQLTVAKRLIGAYTSRPLELQITARA